MTSIPGLNMPTQTAMLAGNPRDSAIAAQANATDKLVALNKAVGGYSHSVANTNIGVWRDFDSPMNINQRDTLWTGRRYAAKKERRKVYTNKHRKTRHIYTRKLTKKRCGRKRCQCQCPCKVCRTMCMYRTHGRKRSGGSAAPATVQVPQFTMQYAPTGGPGQTPNDLIKQNSQISTQSAANAVFDKYATQK